MPGTPVPYFQSLNRHLTVCGVDRAWFYVCVALSLSIAFSARLSLFMDTVAAMIFLIGHVVGVYLTRLDPQIVAVYRRHIHYRRHYDPYAGIHAPVPVVKPSVPQYTGQRGWV